ncbi:MAG: hypothetical protein WC578_01800 [Candidatus Omnitrophota bacterium]
MFLEPIRFYLFKDISYFWLKASKTAKHLDIDDVISRLCINDKDIINTVYSIQYDLLAKEEKRRSDLDSKAYSLIGIVGVCITIIFGLGGILLEKIKEPANLIILTVLYLGAFLFGMLSLIFALLAARARSDFSTINDEDVFSEKEIAGNICTYKRYLSAHYWQIYQKNFNLNERKGVFLKITFRMFFSNIIFLLLIVIVISYSSLRKEDKIMSSSKGKPPATSTPTTGKLATASVVKPQIPEPTSKPTSGKSVTERKE